MRKTIKNQKEFDDLSEIICNKCGRPVKKYENGYFPDCLSVDKRWGYHSDKDGEIHSFDICQDCYGIILSEFKIPADVKTGV